MITIPIPETDSITATMRLRFVERNVVNMVPGAGATGYTQKVLQQMFVDSKGRYLWRDVPLELED